MVPVQWLIDLLRTIQQQGSFTQVGFVAAIVSTVLLVISWVKREFRRGYQDIEDENGKLKAQVESNKEILNKVRRENADLQREIESLQARLPEAVLSFVDREIRDGNYEMAITNLQGMFDNTSPALADCFSRLSELVSAPSADSADDDVASDAERYRRLAALLLDAQKYAPPS